jgi:hypothetical protein
MPIRRAGLLCGGVLLLSTPGAAVAAPLKVAIRIEGAHSTLVPRRTVTLADAPIVKDGDPSHACPGQSALGAIQAGTKGDWSGTWSEGLGYFVAEIRGEKPTGSAFFSLWVDHKLSSTGACQTNLRAGDDVLLFVDRCVFDTATNACKDKPVTPLGVRVPRRVHRGHTFQITVVRYTSSGKALPQAGAKVYANRRRLRSQTDRHGHLRVRATHVGKVGFYARHAGNAKSEVDTTRILEP